MFMTQVHYFINNNVSLLFSRINEDGTETKPHLIHETDTKWSIVINMANVEQNNVRVSIMLFGCFLNTYIHFDF